MQILAADAVLYSDGGGKVAAALAPIRGADHIARFFLGIMRKAPPGLEIPPRARERPARVDGRRCRTRS